MTTRLRVAGAVAGAISLVLGAGASWIGERFDRDMTLAVASVAQGSRLAATRRGVIEYQERGSGLALLAVHGSGGGQDQKPLMILLEAAKCIAKPVFIDTSQENGSAHS